MDFNYVLSTEIMAEAICPRIKNCYKYFHMKVLTSRTGTLTKLKFHFLFVMPQEFCLNLSQRSYITNLTTYVYNGLL